jgi:hypothetical protein
LKTRLTKLTGFIITGTGILLILASILFTPGFIATHFSSTGVLKNEIVQVLELSAVCLGLLAAVLGVNLIYPDKAQRLLGHITALGEIFESRRLGFTYLFIVPAYLSQWHSDCCLPDGDQTSHQILLGIS